MVCAERANLLMNVKVSQDSMTLVGVDPHSDSVELCATGSKSVMQKMCSTKQKCLASFPFPSIFLFSSSFVQLHKKFGFYVVVAS